jgi:lysyl endopeptidase
MNKIINTLLICCLFWGLSNAQTTPLGPPKSWSLKNEGIRMVETHQMPAFDLSARLAADAENEANKVGPWRFGYEFPVNFGIQNSGNWTELDNGDRIWRIRFRSEGALSMNFIFDQFKLPEGATVYIYASDRSEYLGAYTAANNNEYEMLGSMLVQGEDVMVEYYEPAAVRGLGKFNIGTVIHGYRAVRIYLDQLKALNDSGNCNHDVNCPLGNGWQNQINSVALMMSGGSGFCTGALVNNTAQDGTPYFLTADHCLGGSPATWVFRFNWDSPNPVCAQNANSTDPGGPYNDVNGAVLRANDGGSDFGLLELNASPTGSNVYYAGWNRSSTPASGAMAIHHPSGDIKKISQENNPLSAASWGGASTWQVADWDQGTTEPGSSGSPLFDPNQRIIGQLYGGSAACSGLSNNGSPDYYGRFDVSWTGGGSSNSRLRDWLDPTGSGVMTLDGYDPNASTVALDAGLQSVDGLDGPFCNQTSFSPEVNMRNYGSVNITSATITYNVDGGSNSTYNWSGTLTPGNFTNVILPNITISTDGAHSFNATVTSPNGQLDSNNVNNTITQNFDVTLGGEDVSLDLTTDCWGSETSWTLESGSTTILSGGGYSDGQPTLHNEALCLPAGCYTFTIEDAYGDGLEGSAYQSCGVDGDYVILGPTGDTLVAMTDAAFGTSSTHNFCVTATATTINPTAPLTHQLNIFPNPTQGQFSIELSLNKEVDVQFEVYNNIGQLIDQYQANGSTAYFYDVNLRDASAGMYYVRIMAGDQVWTKKVVKE